MSNFLVCEHASSVVFYSLRRAERRDGCGCDCCNVVGGQSGASSGPHRPSDPPRSKHCDSLAPRNE